MLLNLAILLVGLIVLIYGADFLVDGGSALAHRLKVSAMVIGLTIVAFGTSAPELVVSVVSAIKGNSAIALGNVVGSNIFNILAILGVTALVIPLGVSKTTTWIDVPLAVFAAILILLFSMLFSIDVISRIEALVLLFFFVLFLIYTFGLAKYGTKPKEEVEIKNYSIQKSILFILLGLIGLIAGGRMLVSGAVHIAQYLGISERIIGLTIVSVGTSLPELATSVIAARKKNADIAIGNVVGSNIFNTFLILGTSATIMPLQVPPGSSTDLWVNLISALMLFAFIFMGKGHRINRMEGAIFLAMYIGYLIFIITKPM